MRPLKIPRLPEVIANPELIEHLSPPVAKALAIEIGTMQQRMMLQAIQPDPATAPPDDDVVRTALAAQLLGVSAKTLRHCANAVPWCDLRVHNGRRRQLWSRRAIA